MDCEWFGVGRLHGIDTQRVLRHRSGETSSGGSDTGGAGDTGSSDTATSGDTGGRSTDDEPNFEVGDSVMCEMVPVDVAGAVGEAVASSAVTIQSGEGDTGNVVDTGGDVSDSADPGMSAAQRAGELGGFGCGCGDNAGAASAVSIWGLLVALTWRRRRK